tara:strand:+ start:977 stop:1660 length:684 start_codon:yes stop_codon:yes gene_type:complete
LLLRIKELEAVIVKKIEVVNYPTLPYIFSPPVKTNKRIIVYGDSYADAVLQHQRDVENPDSETDNNVHSWQHFLACFLCAEVISYGIQMASEQLIYKIHNKTVDEPRDATIIYHTNPTRSDRFYSQPLLTVEDYKVWDKLCEEYPTVHLYWSDYAYKFTNGVSFKSDYHLKFANGEYWAGLLTTKKRKVDERYRNFSANHMTIHGSMLLAIQLTRHFKNNLNWEGVF